jgi:hypothetical protein
MTLNYVVMYRANGGVSLDYCASREEANEVAFKRCSQGFDDVSTAQVLSLFHEEKPAPPKVIRTDVT